MTRRLRKEKITHHEGSVGKVPRVQGSGTSICIKKAR